MWFLAFFMALTGGGTQGLGLSLQSPLPRALTGFSPFGKLGDRIIEVVRGDALYLGIFIAVVAAVGAAVIAVSVFAQGSAIRGVADLEFSIETSLRDSLSLSLKAFRRLLVLTIMFLILTAALAVPSLVFWSKFGKGSEGVLFPCILSLLIELIIVVLSVLLTIIYDFSCRYVVLRSMGIIGAVRAAVSLIRAFFRETLLAWFTVFLVSLLGTVVMAIIVATLSSPLNSLFQFIYNHHNGLWMALGMLVAIVAWLIIVMVSGFFAVTASAVWTVSFLEFEAVPVC